MANGKQSFILSIGLFRTRMEVEYDSNKKEAALCVA